MTGESEGGAVLEGIVVGGDARGRELGFPTANVELAGSIEMPADGVYAARCEDATGAVHVAAVSVGTRPTYYADHGKRLVEAYLLDFTGDLYGDHLRLVLVERVRGQERFASSEELVTQMHRDVAAVRRLAAAGALGPMSSHDS